MEKKKIVDENGNLIGWILNSGPLGVVGLAIALLAVIALLVWLCASIWFLPFLDPYGEKSIYAIYIFLVVPLIHTGILLYKKQTGFWTIFNRLFISTFLFITIIGSISILAGHYAFFKYLIMIVFVSAVLSVFPAICGAIIISIVNYFRK